jgi:glycosyltransferase involved in cell wall biosynthesis
MLGGVPSAVDIARRGLVALGHDVVIVAPRMPGSRLDEPGVLRVPAVPAPTYPDFALPLPATPWLRRRLRALTLDVYHAQHPFLLGGTARRLARENGRPLVFTYHTLYDKYAHYVPLPRDLVARWAIRWSTAFANAADLVLAPSEAVAARLRAQGVRRPVETLPTGVDLERFRPGDRRAARQALGLAPGDPVALYVGRIDREKNLGLLLEGVARARVPALRLLLVGRGTEVAALRRSAPARRLGPRLELRGAVEPEALAAYCRAADLFVFASTTETQGLAVLEAMATQLPVVAVRAGGVEEAVVDGVSGLLVPEDPAALATAVEQVLGDPGLAAKLGAGGREAARRFAAPALAARLAEAYVRVLGERP